MGLIAFLDSVKQRDPAPRSLASTVSLATNMMLAAALVLLVFALEGLICIAMAAPIAAPLGILGAILGRAVAGAGGPQTAPLLPLRRQRKMHAVPPLPNRAFPRARRTARRTTGPPIATVAPSGARKAAARAS
jgi:hypothetical protein